MQCAIWCNRCHWQQTWKCTSSCGKIMYIHKLDLRVQWRAKFVVNNSYISVSFLHDAISLYDFLMLTKAIFIWWKKWNIVSILITFFYQIILKCNLFLWWKAEFSASSLQSSVSHVPSEIILIWWFTAQGTFLIISVETITFFKLINRKCLIVFFLNRNCLQDYKCH